MNANTHTQMLKNKARTQKFSRSESKIRQNGKEGNTTDKTFCDFSFLFLFFSLFSLCFGVYLALAHALVRLALEFQFFYFIVVCVYIIFSSLYTWFVVCLVLFAFHCALSYLFLILSSPWNVLLTFPFFFLRFFSFSFSFSFSLPHSLPYTVRRRWWWWCGVVWYGSDGGSGGNARALYISAQTNIHTHRKVLNFIQDFYLIRITYISNSSFCFCRLLLLAATTMTVTAECRSGSSSSSGRVA